MSEMSFDEAYRTLAVWRTQYAALGRIGDILELAAKANSTEQEIQHRLKTLRENLSKAEEAAAVAQAEREDGLARLDREIEAKREAWRVEREKRNAEINQAEDDARKRLADIRAIIADEERRGLATKTNISAQISELTNDRDALQAAVNDLKSRLGQFMKV